jgi:hypothetical protein
MIRAYTDDSAVRALPSGSWDAALSCGFDELVVGSDAGDRRLVDELVVDDIAVAAAFVAFSADKALAL